MKRMPCKAFFSVTTPETGERKVSVRFAAPDFAKARICSSEMSQFLRRSKLDSASCCMPLRASLPASFKASTPWAAMVYSR